MKRPVRIIVLVILSLILLLLLSGWALPRFLKFKKPVSTHNILLESWISAFEIEQAVQEFGSDPENRFFLVGMEYPDDFEFPFALKDYNLVDENGIWLYTNSSLIIQLPDKPSYRKGDTLHVSIEAKGQQAGGEFAHFNVVVEGHIIGGNFTTENEQEYIFQYILPIEKFNSIAIRFNNDLGTEEADRNLNIGAVRVDDFVIFPRTASVEITREQNCKTTGYISLADEVADYLVKLGIDRARICIIRFNHEIRNKTREAALAFKNSSSLKNVDNINVVTSGIHSRRTWVTYRKVLGDNMDVGVVYFADSSIQTKVNIWNRNDYLTTFNEFLSYLANWITLFFLEN
ncbi:MAG: YdcF family protein [Bacteroidales bacterium]|nr:YdcF family protein [Bacteroidales bacterium]